MSNPEEVSKEIKREEIGGGSEVTNTQPAIKKVITPIIVIFAVIAAVALILILI